MPRPERPKQYHEKDMTDHTIDGVAGQENLSQSDLNKVAVSAQIQAKIDEYRATAAGMTPEEMEEEKHLPSRLAEFMGERPSHCHAHAIVSGAHLDAAPARAILAWLEMRIDDPHNGCWLPVNTAAVRHVPQWLKKAVPHSRIHRKGYYFWLNTVISVPRVGDMNSLIMALNEVETKLQASTMPSYVMLTAEELRKRGMIA